MTTNKNFRVKNGLEVGADGIKFADDTVMTTAPTGGGSSYDQDLNTTATVVFSGLTINNTTITAGSSNVKSLLLAEDATDEVGNTVTLNGSAAVSTAQVKYGSNSFYLPGTTSDYVSVANSSSFNLGSNDFDIDFWLYPLTDVTTGNPTIASRWAGNQWIIQGSGTANQYYALVQANGQQFVYFTVADNAWNHIAITRFGNTLNVYVDGVLQESNTSISGSVSDSTGDIILGLNGEGPQQPFNGYIDNFRLIVGDKKFDGTFTPPLENEYTIDGGTTSTTTTNVLEITTSTVKTFVGITFADDTVMTTAQTYDQSLNTSDNVQFNQISAGNNIQLINQGYTLNLNSGHIANAIHIDMVTGEDGRITFSDGTVQTTAYTGGGLGIYIGSTAPENTATLWLDESDPNGVGIIGVPTGGTTGQVLAKVDSTDYNIEWIEQSGGSASAITTSTYSDIPTTGSVGDVRIIVDSSADDGADSVNDGLLAYWNPTIDSFAYTHNNMPVNAPTYVIDYLVVAGGGGAGGQYAGGATGGGGAGAGGMLTATVVVLSGSSYTVTVGSGGSGGGSAANGTKGSNSSLGTIAVASAGGAGLRADQDNAALVNGGSGGGASGSNGQPIPGTGIVGQGHDGGFKNDSRSSAGNFAGGGGGGAGAAADGRFAGAGLAWFDGNTYAEGGNGQGDNSGGNISAGTSGSANTGNGGNGASTTGTPTGGNGGSGVVIVRYAGSPAATGGTITESGGYTYHTFTSSDTLAF